MGGSGDLYRGMNAGTQTRQYDARLSVVDFDAAFARYVSLSQAAPARLERRASTVYDKMLDLCSAGQNLGKIGLYTDMPHCNHFNLAEALATPGTALNNLLLAVIRRRS